MKRSAYLLLTAAALLSLSACSIPKKPEETLPQEESETYPQPSSIIEEMLKAQEAETETSFSEEEEEAYSFENGLEIQKVPDLITGEYRWQSVVKAGEIKYDKFGGEYRNYDVEPRYYETVDGTEKLDVRRWDNLKYSCGDYLIYEYDGTLYVSKPDKLYEPVLSFENGSDICRAGDNLMVENFHNSFVYFYDRDFNPLNQLDGVRVAGEDVTTEFSDGYLPVEETQTGKFGYLDTSGTLVLPFQYDAATNFSNGYAGVLVGAELAPYTEDSGTVTLHLAQGGQWGIIDKQGAFVLEPTEKTGNTAENEEEKSLYGGAKGFGPVRADGTVDFVNRMDGSVLFTEKLY